MALMSRDLSRDFGMFCLIQNVESLTQTLNQSQVKMGHLETELQILKTRNEELEEIMVSSSTASAGKRTAGKAKGTAGKETKFWPEFDQTGTCIELRIQVLIGLFSVLL